MNTEAMESDSGRLLVVEDDSGMRQLLVDELQDHHEVMTATRVAEARSILSEWPPDVVIADLKLADGEAMSLLPDIREFSLVPAFVIITAFGSIPQAVDALKLGVDDFLTKPLDLDHLRLRVRRLIDVQRLKRTVRGYREPGDRTFYGIIGRSARMQRLFQEVRQVAAANGPVLIVGESGVGKEMVARALHAESRRAEGPFVPVNCAALPEALVESELFGHVAGAFTGADRTRRGLFTEARGGTVLLDEVTELPHAMQAKLLRTLQEGTIRPVGANKEEAVDIRVVAASNRGIQQEVEHQRFREDLYYRLETFTLHIPPLRERPEDIDVLAAHFLSRLRLEGQKQIEGLSAEALQALRSYEFPGNVRELRNVIERAVAFCGDVEIQPDDLGPDVVQKSRRDTRRTSFPPALLDDGNLPSLEELKRRYVRFVVDQLDGNKRRAATLLGIGRRTLYRYLEP